MKPPVLLRPPAVPTLLLPPAAGPGPPLPEPGPVFLPQRLTGDKRAACHGRGGGGKDTGGRGGPQKRGGRGEPAAGRYREDKAPSPPPQATSDERRKRRPPIGSRAGKAQPITARSRATRLSVARRGFDRLRRQGHVTFCLHPLSCWGPSSPRRLSHRH